MADSNDQSQAPSEQVCSFFRRPTMNTNTRKRAVESNDVVDDHDQDASHTGLRNTRKVAKAHDHNRLYFTSTRFEPAHGAFKSETEEISGQPETKEIRGRAKTKEVREKPEKEACIRASVRFDYQPDVCKDYKKAGHCGYGDSCKFLHDRGDYKSGWQMEREWDEAEKARRRKLAMGIVDDEVEEGDDHSGESFACPICSRPFDDPVVVKCKHCFCRHCALKHHHSKSKKCFVCNEPTFGIFNTAHEIRKRMALEIE